MGINSNFWKLFHFWKKLTKGKNELNLTNVEDRLYVIHLVSNGQVFKGKLVKEKQELLHQKYKALSFLYQ